MAKRWFEFSRGQNKTLRSLARMMKYTALLFLSLGIAIALLCVFTITRDLLHGLGYLALSVAAATFGVWTNSISYSLKQIVETKGHDIEILMKAFNTFRYVYMLQFIWLFIVTLLTLAILIMSTIFGLQAIPILAS
jgi:hypothetical protein